MSSSSALKIFLLSNEMNNERCFPLGVVWCKTTSLRDVWFKIPMRNLRNYYTLIVVSYSSLSQCNVHLCCIVWNLKESLLASNTFCRLLVNWNIWLLISTVDEDWCNNYLDFMYLPTKRRPLTLSGLAPYKI